MNHLYDAYKNLGTDEPAYIVHGEDIMVKFTALRSSKVTDSKASKLFSQYLSEVIESGLDNVRDNGGNFINDTLYICSIG